MLLDEKSVDLAKIVTDENYLNQMALEAYKMLTQEIQ